MDFESYLDYIREAIFVVDNSFDVVSFNDAFKKLFPAAKKSEYIGYCINACPELDALVRESGGLEPGEPIAIGGGKFAVYSSDIWDERGQAPIARSFVLSDVTDYTALVSVSEESNLMLQKSNEAIKAQKESLELRTRLKEEVAAGAEIDSVLRELHDTLGHSLTVLNCLNRLALLERKKTETSRGELEETVRLARISLAELDTIDVLTIGDREKTMTITAFLYRLKQTMLGVSLSVRLIITGVEEQLHEKLFYTVTGIVREAATNCLRHANATELDVSVDFGRTLLRLDIEDNGALPPGAAGLNKGNGLTGMERRVGDCGGEIEMGIGEHGGVFLHVRLPVRY